jgi:hypothetical protein
VPKAAGRLCPANLPQCKYSNALCAATHAPYYMREVSFDAPARRLFSAAATDKNRSYTAPINVRKLVCVPLSEIYIATVWYGVHSVTFRVNRFVRHCSCDAPTCCFNAVTLFDGTSE